ncbi:cytochrome P450 family protein [Streptomyces sp. NPDC003703]|uniref:cytochrome P450 family protein n=1 Tax=Streptomyces sp. NPDC003283 TaxID=3364681 RepID=UPI0036BBD8CD
MGILSRPGDLSLDEPVFQLDPVLDTYTEAGLLRQYGPLAPIGLPDDVRAWATTTEESARIVLESHPDLAKNPRHWGAYQRGEIPAGWPLLPFIAGESMLFADGGDHLRLRRSVVPAFTPRRVNALAPRVERLTLELLDAVEAAALDAPGNGVDLKELFAYPLALRIICEFFGITEETRRAALRDHYATMLSLTASDAQRQAAALGLREELALLVDEKRAAPGDDLTSVLVGITDEDGDRLTGKELLDTLQLVLIAGHETVVNGLTNTVHALLTHPGQLGLLLGGEHDWADALEAGLAWDGPLRNVYMRFALRDTEILGVPVREGEPIIVLLAAAHRDGGGDGLPESEGFDVTRGHKGHLGFGAGPHYCIGAPLARLEGTIALRELFTRFPGLRLAVPAEDLEHLVSPAVNGLTALPVRLG